eukprot:4418890-Amphidinium_carterae.1
MAEAILAAMSARAKAKSQPRGSASSGDTDMQETVRLLTRLSLSHESSISTMTACTCLSIAVVNEDWKNELSGIKQTYKNKGWGEAPPTDGPCLRAACHATVLVRLGQALIPSDASSKAIAEKVTSMTAEVVATTLV